MDQTYIKCALCKGFAIVVDDPIHLPIKNCFPEVAFFDEKGDAIGLLSPTKVHTLYEAICQTYPEYSEHNNLNDRDILNLHDTKRKQYKIAVMAGFIHYIDPELELSYKNSLAIMDKPASIRLKKAIDEIA
jgi:hypothetical protein